MIGSRLTGRVVLMTLVALFLVTFSLTMFWYHYNYAMPQPGGSVLRGEVKFAINYYTSDWYTYEYSRTGYAAGTVMVTEQAIVIIWFLLALAFVGVCFLHERQWSIMMGTALALVSMASVLYFALSIANGIDSDVNAPHPFLPGFVGTATNALGDSVTCGPLNGFWLATFACILQVSAVVLRIYAVRSTKASPQY